MKRIIAALLNLIASLFYSPKKENETVKQIASESKEEPIRFEGILTNRPEWMDYGTYRSILKAQNKRLKLYLRNKRFNGYMGYSVNAYNTPYTLS